MRRALLCLCAVVCLCTGAHATAILDVAPWASVRVETGSVRGAPLRSVFDARWAGAWDEGIVWDDRSTVLRVDFGGTVELTDILLQAHEDDAFHLDYLYEGSWNPLWTAEQTAARNFRALPNPAQTMRAEMFAGTFADAIRIYASPLLAYDPAERFGVARLAIYGAPVTTSPGDVPTGAEVPEPAGPFTAVGALAIVVFVARRKGPKS